MFSSMFSIFSNIDILCIMIWECLTSKLMFSANSCYALNQTKLNTCRTKTNF